MRVRTGRLHAPGGFTRRRLAVPLPPLWRAQPWSLWIEAQAAASQATRPIEASHARAHGPCRIHAPLVSHSPAAAQRAHLAADLSAHASGHALSMYSAFLSHLRLSPAHARLASDLRSPRAETSACRSGPDHHRTAAAARCWHQSCCTGPGRRPTAYAVPLRIQLTAGGGSKHSFQSQALLQFDRMYSWFAAHSPLAAQAAQSDSDGVASGATARVNNIITNFNSTVFHPRSPLRPRIGAPLGDFTAFRNERNIGSELSPPHDHDLNAIAERFLCFCIGAHSTRRYFLLNNKAVNRVRS